MVLLVTTANPVIIFFFGIIIWDNKSEIAVSAQQILMGVLLNLFLTIKIKQKDFCGDSGYQ